MDDAREQFEGRYTLIRRLGAGGMAEVWLALDQRLDRPVALKVLREQYRDDPDLVARLEREARAVAGLNHPSIAQVYDVIGHAPGRVAIVMEFVPGGDLRELLAAEGPLPLKRALALLQEIAQGVAAAHEAGLIHRDLKPSNVLLSRTGHAKVTDFGIARAIAGAGLTEPGHIWGTSHYLAPEQAQGAPLTPSADVYALGVMLFEMLTGTPPFPGDDPIAVALAHINTPPPDVRTLLPMVPPGVARLVARLLAKAPGERPINAAHVAGLLDRYLTTAGEPTTFRPISPPRPRPAPDGIATLDPVPQRSPPPKELSPPSASQVRAQRPVPVPPSVAVPASSSGLYQVIVAALLLSFIASFATVFWARARLPIQNANGAPVVGVSPTGAATMGVISATATIATTPIATSTLSIAMPTQTIQPSPAPPRRRDNGPEFRVPQLQPGAVTLDGNLAEWTGSGLTLNTVLSGGEAWESPRDVSGQAWAAWDARDLYIALRVLDERHLQQWRGSAVEQGDSVVLWLDTDLQGDFEVADGNGDDWELVFSPGDFESILAEGAILHPVRSRQQETTLRIRAQPGPNGYTLEARIPWGTLGIMPEPELLLGYGVALLDSDLAEEGAPQTLVGSPATFQRDRPTTFGTLTLLP